LKGVEVCASGLKPRDPPGGEKRREKSLRIDVHDADAVVWGPVYRTRLTSSPPSSLPNLATSGVSSVRFACRSRQFGSQSAMRCSYIRRGFSVDFLAYAPGTTTDQFSPLYRTGGAAGAAGDGAGSRTGAIPEASSIVVVVEVSASAGGAVSSSARAGNARDVIASAAAVAETSASRRDDDGDGDGGDGAASASRADARTTR
jgi:hypothetical protein